MHSLCRSVAVCPCAPSSYRRRFRDRSANVQSFPNVLQVKQGGACSILHAVFLARQKSQDLGFRDLGLLNVGMSLGGLVGCAESKSIC
jgi:hypothetical protein